jgi:hypothetical protein
MDQKVTGQMKKKALLALVLFSLAFASCSKKGMEMLIQLHRFAESVAEQQAEQQEEKLTFEEASRRMELWRAIETKDVDKVKRYLEEGYDPNKSRGEQGYRDRNPLNIIAKSFYTTHARLVSGEELPDPPPDVAILELLVSAGADVNRRPYIWCRINTWDNFSLDSHTNRKTLSRVGNYPKTEAEMEEFEDEKIIASLYFIKDANRVLEAFLKAGADPDMRGHPYPYSHEAHRARITDKEADEYFSTGTRPINEAIKKGMRWESQVDLLLQYTTLDEDSLSAARESEDTAMIAKITKLINHE